MQVPCRRSGPIGGVALGHRAFPGRPRSGCEGRAAGRAARSPWPPGSRGCEKRSSLSSARGPMDHLRSPAEQRRSRAWTPRSRENQTLGAGFFRMASVSARRFEQSLLHLAGIAVVGDADRDPDAHLGAAEASSCGSCRRSSSRIGDDEVHVVVGADDRRPGPDLDDLTGDASRSRSGRRPSRTAR